MNQYNTKATGILTSNRAEYFGFEKLSAAQLSNLSATARADLATYPADWPDYEIVIADLGFAPGADYAQAIGMLEAQVARGGPIYTPSYVFFHRKSLTIPLFLAGSVTIRSSDTSDPPVVDTNTFGSATDRAVAVSLFKRIRALMGTRAYAPIMGPEILPGAAVQTDAQIVDYLIGNVGPGYHGTCTCQ